MTDQGGLEGWPPAYRSFNEDLRKVLDLHAEGLLRALLEAGDHGDASRSPTADAMRILSAYPGHVFARDAVGEDAPPLLPEGYPKELALAALVLWLSEDLHEAREGGPGPAMRRLLTKLKATLIRIEADRRSVEQWVQGQRAFFAKYPLTPLDRLEATADFLESLRDLQESIEEMEEHHPARERGRPPKAILADSEAYLRACGFRDRRVTELLGDGGTTERAIRRLRDRRAARAARKEEA